MRLFELRRNLTRSARDLWSSESSSYESNGMSISFSRCLHLRLDAILVT